MDRPFAWILRRAVVHALGEFRRQVPDESPYAFAMILDHGGGYLGYAIATEEGLRRVAAEYATKGYRYRGREWEQFDNVERLATWLRWANPDDGWRHGDFSAHFEIARLLACSVQSGTFGEDAEGLEEFCTEVLATLKSDPDWMAAVSGVRVVFGVTSGDDPRDFLRTATRANEYGVVTQLWSEHWRGEELSGRISAQRSEPT